MAGGATGERWRDRRVASWALRLAVFVAPILAAILVVWIYTRFVDRPASIAAQIVFWLVAAVLAIAAAIGVDHHARKLLPVAMLLRMSLGFPGTAPNRMALAFGDGATEPADLEATSPLTAADTAARHLLGLVRVLSRHEPRTRGHAERVRAYADMIGRELGLDDDELERVQWGALIHDVGKLSVPPELLAGGDRPSPDELAQIREHAIAAEPYLYAVADWLGEGVLAAVQHHERWDGDGYPDGLAGTDISLPARIVAVADAYDAMTATRSYREPLRPSMAREQIARNAGAQFDPTVVGAFLDVSVWRLRLVLGPLGWLNETLFFTRLPHAATGAVATAAVAGIVGVVAAVVFSSPADGDDDSVVAGGGDIDVVVETTSTTTTTPTTTSIVLDPPTTTSSTTTTTTAPATTAAPAPPSTTAAPTTTSAPPTTTTSTTSTTTTTTTTTTTVAPTPPVPTGTGFALTDPAAVPPDLSDGQLTSDTVVFVWSEGVATTARDIELKSFVDGDPVMGDSTDTATLPAGTQVCTYVVHADPVGPTTVFTAELDFGVVPLGFSLTTADLDDTAEFELDGVDYQTDGLGSTDSITVDGTVISIALASSPGGRDQVRIFVPC